MQIQLTQPIEGQWITAEDLDKYPDILIATEYLLMKEADNHPSMEMITANLYHKYPNMPETRPGLYYRIETWRRDGTLRRAQEIFLAPKIEEMRAVIDETITEIPSIIRGLIVDAKDNKKSSSQRLEILQYLVSLTRGETEKFNDAGDKERGYIKSGPNFDPILVEED